MKTALLSLLLLVAGVPTSAQQNYWPNKKPPSNLESYCKQFKDARPWTACIFKTPGSQSNDVLYYLHGLNGDAMTWASLPDNGAIRNWWSGHGIGAPTVVSISFGRSWLLAPKNPSGYSGLYEVFTQKIMPFVEEKLGGVKGRRLLMGESMGGFNATQLLLKTPKLFSRIVLACPALAKLSPYSPRRDISAYIDRTHASTGKVYMSVQLTRRYYPSPEIWERDAAPFNLGRSQLGLQSPELMISIGMQDSFGFQEGSRDFAVLAHEKGVEVAWRAVQGDHCSMNTAAIAEFLAKR